MGLLIIAVDEGKIKMTSSQQRVEEKYWTL
jgi:hypothetical protein